MITAEAGIVRQEFGAVTSTRQSETSTAAMAAAAQAEIQARYIIVDAAFADWDARK